VLREKEDRGVKDRQAKGRPEVDYRVVENGLDSCRVWGLTDNPQTAIKGGRGGRKSQSEQLNVPRFKNSFGPYRLRKEGSICRTKGYQPSEGGGNGKTILERGGRSCRVGVTNGGGRRGG